MADPFIQVAPVAAVLVGLAPVCVAQVAPVAAIPVAVDNQQVILLCSQLSEVLIFEVYSSYTSGSEIAPSWSPMQLTIECWRPEFYNWSPAGELLSYFIVDYVQRN